MMRRRARINEIGGLLAACLVAFSLAGCATRPEPEQKAVAAEVPAAATNYVLKIENGRLKGIDGDCPRELELPAGVREIECLAFSGCSTLETLVIPEGVTNIGWQAFVGCSGLRSLKIPKSVTRIDGSAFSDCKGLGSGIVLVDGWVLHVPGECSGDVVLPPGTRMLADRVFIGCPLKSVVVPEGVVEISYGAFEKCNKLESVNLPSSLRRIGSRAFCGCENLKDLTIPAGVTEVGGSVFWGSPVQAEGQTVKDGCLVACSPRRSRHVMIPQGVRLIASDVFEGCSRLRTVSIPSSVKVICAGAFADCRKLTGVYFEGPPVENLREAGLLGRHIHIRYSKQYSNEWEQALRAERSRK